MHIIINKTYSNKQIFIIHQASENFCTIQIVRYFFFGAAIIAD